MRKSLALVFGVVVALMLAPSANAAISTVFNEEDTPLNCAVDGSYRYCGSATSATSVESFDGTPIDVYLALPADPNPTTDGDYPVVGIYHGWGGSKINLKTNTLAQDLLAEGFAVFTMTDRGWGGASGGSCGGPSATVKPAPCATGYIHLMHNQYEVRDAQYVLSKLADDRNDADDAYVIDSTKIGATGGSYGGGMTEALAMLKDRVQTGPSTYIPWESPINGRSLEIAGAAPEYTWTDLSSALIPNGSTLDYAADNPYYGPDSDHRVGVPKQQWTFSLYASGPGYGGFYAPVNYDPSANITAWYALITGGGPYDNNPNITGTLAEIQNNHSSYYIPINDTTDTPAPMLISGGWNDDLFPFNEALRLYNKVRAESPSTPVAVWGNDAGGHSPRGNVGGAANTADRNVIRPVLVSWLVKYVKGDGSETLPFNDLGGAAATSSKCSGQSRVAGDTTYSTGTWFDMMHGEVQITGDAQTIGQHTSPADQFVGTSSDVCDYAGRTDDTEGAAVYKTDITQSGGVTIIGSPTVEATMDVTSAGDQIVARLFDYDPSGVGHQRLIGRAIYRPQGVGAGPTKQVFQLFPQNYAVAQGHTLKLELLSSDTPFTQSSVNPAQKPIKVTDLKLSVPVAEDGTASGSDQVEPISPKTLPAGYEFSQDALDTDTVAPTTTDNVPATLQASVTVTLTATDEGISGVDKTYYTTGATPATPTTASTPYDPNNKPQLADGEKISYFSVDKAGNEGNVVTSQAAQVDNIKPVKPTLVSGPAATISTNSASASWTSGELVATYECELDGSAKACGASIDLTGLSNGAHTLNVWTLDSVGNKSLNPLTIGFTVRGKLSTSVKISGTAKIGKSITAKPSSKVFGASVTGVTYKYTWTANGKKIGSKSKIKLSKKWKGKKIVVKVSSSKSGYDSGSGSKTATSKLK